MLAGHPVFGELDSQALDQVAAICHAQPFGAGETIVREGEPGDRFYLIARGLAEVSTGSEGAGQGEACLGALGPGDHLGEIALLAGDGQRTATVRAVTDVATFAMPARDFEALIRRHPEIRRQLEALASTSLAIRFLKQATPFTNLEPAALRQLVGKLRLLRVEQGATVIRQGEEGDACYLLRSGAIEVVAGTGDGGVRTLAELAPGDMFGEIGLLIGAKRNATVRATAPCELLALSRQDLREILPDHRALETVMYELVAVRRRPKRATPVTEHRRPTRDGDGIVVLRHEHSHRYYQLSPQGWFVWQKLDGDTTLKDLTLAFVRAYKEFAPDKIARIIDGLARAGFVDDAGLPAADSPAGGGWEGLLHRVRGLLEARVTLHNVDRAFDALYRHGGFIFFLRPVQLLLAALCLCGVAAAASAAHGAVATLFQSNPLVLLWVLPFNLLAVVLHETGHALAVKHAGRVVRGAGVGWYWFHPIAFIDTTDIWLASQRQRITVSLAGPVVDAVVGSIAAIVAWSTSDLTQLIAMQFAVVSYISVLANLNPLLEYDGYHVLVDLLERPGLRRRALQWLRQARFTRAELAGHRVDLLYGVGSVAYVLVMIVLTVTIMRLAFGAWLQSFLSQGQASALAWAVALLIALTASAGMWHDLRAAPDRRG